MFNSCKSCSLSKNLHKNTKRLSDLEIGDEAVVINVAGNDDLRIKIMEMGVVNGINLKVIKKSPFNDPIVILIRDYDLSIRKNEAELVLVSKI